MKYPNSPGSRTGDVSVRKSVLGSRYPLSLRGLGAALGIFVVVLLGALLSTPTTSWAQPQLSLFLVGWLASILTAGYLAYRNSGILVSWLLALAPAVAQLAYFTWRHGGREAVPAPVGPGPFGTFGAGAWLFWIPFSVLVGTLCFGFGVAVRWGEAYADD